MNQNHVGVAILRMLNRNACSGRDEGHPNAWVLRFVPVLQLIQQACIIQTGGS